MIVDAETPALLIAIFHLTAYVKSHE